MFRDYITHFENKPTYYSKAIQNVIDEFERWGGLNLPIIDKTNPKYHLDLSNRLPYDNSLYLIKVGFEVLNTENQVDLEVLDYEKVNVKVSKNLVEAGFFVKDLYLSVISNSDFVNSNFLSIVDPNDSMFFGYGILFIKAGILVYIPKDIGKVNINIDKRFTKGKNGALYNMLYIDSGNDVNVFESISSSGDEPKFIFEFSEILVKDGSNVNFHYLQNNDLNTEYFVSRKVVPLGNNNIEFNTVSLGSLYQREENRIFMKGPNVETKYTCIYFTNDSKRYDLIANIRHGNSSQGADVITKGVLDDKSKVYFNGVLKVDKGLKHINSFLGGHSLHLSSECKSDSVPSLEVDSFDVKSGHAASFTQLDEEKLFYMMSRGLSEEEARKAIVYGFIEGAIRRISNEEFKAKIRELLIRKGLELPLEVEY
jgi:Fe-S cluster assembly scaffold protein SufB